MMEIDGPPGGFTGYPGYPEDIIQLAQNPPCFSKMKGATCTSFLKGPCGDAMEFFLKIEDGKIDEASFYTDGCVSTRVCGSVAAQYVAGKSLEEALGISPRLVLDQLPGLPHLYRHCAILAVSAFYRAASEYLLNR